MDKLIEILEDIESGLDYENCESLVDDNYLDSLDIISLVAAIEDAFNVQIPAVDVIPENFNSVESIWKLINRLEEEG
ncbi:MAG: acyl carrier protein [Clostridia bacterium]|nr:acyl carrier protein [Clostridia bacterium]